jgi:ABC-type antimicrobial peptide transport system permease subunit
MKNNKNIIKETLSILATKTPDNQKSFIRETLLSPQDVILYKKYWNRKDFPTINLEDIFIDIGRDIFNTNKEDIENNDFSFMYNLTDSNRLLLLDYLWTSSRVTEHVKHLLVSTLSIGEEKAFWMLIGSSTGSIIGILAGMVWWKVLLLGLSGATLANLIITAMEEDIVTRNLIKKILRK